MQLLEENIKKTVKEPIRFIKKYNIFFGNVGENDQKIRIRWGKVYAEKNHLIRDRRLPR